MRLSTIWTQILNLAEEEGVLHTSASDLMDSHASLFIDWIANDRHASMAYLAKNVAIRTDPQARYPWAKSAIVLLVPYSSERPNAPEGALSNHVARYALGDDYHDVLDRILRKLEDAIARLAPGAKTWRYVDTGPLSDRSLAAQAGLGWIGKNGMLIHEEHGSYFFIGTLLTSLENDLHAGEVADRCGACTRCLDACPTDAILPNRTVESARCISYATIEHRGAFEIGTAGNAFGCDICQEVCPWNAAPQEPHPAFLPRDGYRATPVTDLLKFTQADFSSLFRRSAVKRAKLGGMKRNVEALTTSP
ncbi:MAG TPA: tRNA epoxyqueuosine(34) reductase QueG [Thermoanaerobaculia bacterium]|jgi:epoxyqueuosine reductase|nr:tRNA epoxyqueuosine(34) reductase QueG [Thermoanaerobaculia bacterium]